MNLLRDLPDVARGEIVTRLAGSETLRIERIVSHGQASPGKFWYDQAEAEFVLVLAGAARLAFGDGETLALEPGDWVDIAPHRRHRVDWTAPDQPTVWLAVFYKPCHSGRSEAQSRNNACCEDTMPSEHPSGQLPSSQLPAPGEVFLDHTAFFVPAMAPAAEALERCGFRLTPFTVAELATLETCLAGSGIEHRRTATGITATLPAGLGDALLFHQA